MGGKSQNALCKEYGVSKSALSKWVKQYSTVETEDGDILTARQVKELQMRNAQLEEENLILKNDCHIHATLRQRLNAVYRLRCQHDIKTLCRVLNVNRSTYYKHFFSEPAPRTVYNRQIKVCILEIYSSFDKSIGAYKIRRVLDLCLASAIISPIVRGG